MYIRMYVHVFIYEHMYTFECSVDFIRFTLPVACSMKKNFIETGFVARPLPASPFRSQGDRSAMATGIGGTFVLRSLSEDFDAKLDKEKEKRELLSKTVR